MLMSYHDKAARALKAKKTFEVAFVLETINKKGGVLKYPKVFQCDNANKLLEKHNVTFKEQQQNTSTLPQLLQAFNKAHLSSFKLMDSQELQDPKKYWQFGLKT